MNKGFNLFLKHSDISYNKSLQGASMFAKRLSVSDQSSNTGTPQHSAWPGHNENSHNFFQI